MKLSAALTIYERETPVLDAMFGSLHPQPFDEMVIVLDRPPHEVAQHCYDYWQGDGRVIFARIDGSAGWKSPVPAWNRAFDTATGDTLFAFSSEMVHAPDNVATARRMLDDEPRSLIFGKASCSCGPGGREVNWSDGSPGNLLVDAAHPRPLGFIWAGPLKEVHWVRGMDPEFARGFCYDDDDFFVRLWRTGLDFTFTDEICGTHLHHERPVLTSADGQAGIHRNAEYMLRKHGTLAPWGQIPRLESRAPGRTTWRHL